MNGHREQCCEEVSCIYRLTDAAQVTNDAEPSQPEDVKCRPSDVSVGGC
jgi:hypothetical protein